MRGWIGIALGIVGLVGTSVVLAAGSAGDPEEMAGAGRCKECHPSAYAAWIRSQHARSNQALDAKQAGDLRCTQCHGLAIVGRQGVQCEACHGPGQHYAVAYVMKDSELARIVGLVEPNVETCRRCHTEATPTLQTFDHDRLWTAIVHGPEPRKSASEPARPPAK